jgi:hypothetical protein
MKTPPRIAEELRSTSREIGMYHRQIAWRSIVLSAALVLCFFSYIPIWMMIAVNVLVYPGVYLRAHDIGHSVRANRYGLFARFIPVASPIWGGTRLFTKIHLEHHAYLGTAKDPWLPFYSGHPLRALFFNFIEPEYSCRNFIRRYGVDRELAVNFLFNISLLAAGFLLFQWIYLIHLVSMRLVHTTAIFFFNFYTHRQSLSADAPVGVYEREKDLGFLLPVVRLLWGRDLLDGLIFHNRHHCLGQIHVPVQKYKYLEDTGVFTR